jgi:parallel beta-helix repeat protein
VDSTENDGSWTSCALADGITKYPSTGWKFRIAPVSEREPSDESGFFSIRESGTGNLPPVSSPTASPTSGNAPLSVTFDSSGSSDPDGTIVSYHWDFGNGADSNEPNLVYTYEELGTYTVTLTVTDDQGATDAAIVGITVVSDIHHITLTSLADSWIQDEGGNSRDDNLGASNVMAIGGRWYNTYFRGLIRFDLSSIPYKATISNGRLQLYHTMNAVEGFNVNNISVYRVLRDWKEHEVAWNNYAADAPWTIPGAGSIGNDRENTALAQRSFTSTTPVYQYYDFDLTSAVQDYVNGTKDFYGFILIGKEAPAENRYFSGFSTKESASNPPLLSITYTPQPGTKPPIQPAIENANDGDTVVIEPGYYHENIDFKGKNLTVRSTDPNDPAVVAATVIKGRSQGPAVTFSSGEDAGCVLAGFSVFGGSAGIYCSGTSPTIANCRVTDNADAGIELRNSSSPTITECRITANWGNGIETWPKRGGRFTYYNYPTIVNCIIAGNRQHGIHSAIPTITNCTIVANQHHGISGLMPEVTNSIIYYNSSDHDGVQIEGNFATVTYSDIQGSWPGIGNMDADPCFVSPGYWSDAKDPNILAEPNDPNAMWVGGDYHLKSQAGRWDPNGQTWFRDTATSPCIDGSAPNSDWTVEFWPHGRRTNIGAYGGTPQASMSLSDLGNIADLNNDDRIDSADVVLLTDKWLYGKALLSEDLDRDGIIDLTDFAILAKNWLWEQ